MGGSGAPVRRERPCGRGRLADLDRPRELHWRTRSRPVTATWGRANTRVTSRQIRHARAIRAFMSRSKRS